MIFFRYYRCIFICLTLLFFAVNNGVYAQSCDIAWSVCSEEVVIEWACVDGDLKDSCNTNWTQENTIARSLCWNNLLCWTPINIKETVSCTVSIDRSTCLDQRAREQPNPWRLRFAIPYENEEDVVAESEYITTVDAEYSFVRTVKTFNEWLWIVIIVSTMLVLIYAWFLLLTSFWKPEKLKTANNVLFYAWIWIWIALFSYVFINIIVNFF